MNLANTLSSETVFTMKDVDSIGFSEYLLPPNSVVLKLGNQIYEGRKENGNY